MKHESMWLLGLVIPVAFLHGWWLSEADYPWWIQVAVSFLLGVSLAVAYWIGRWRGVVIENEKKLPFVWDCLESGCDFKVRSDSALATLKEADAHMEAVHR